MTTEQQKYESAKALSDQAWAGLREYVADIERIAEHGPSSTERDTDIVRMVFYAVRGDIYVRNYEAEGGGMEDEE